MKGFSYMKLNETNSANIDKSYNNTIDNGFNKPSGINGAIAGVTNNPGSMVDRTIHLFDTEKIYI